MEQNQALRKSEIMAQLQHVLLEDGKMFHSLYEHELEEHVDHWYASLQADHDEFLFVVTENNGHSAMVLIMPNKAIYINEEGKKKLEELWPNGVYEHNLRQLIPGMAQQLANNEFPVHGVKTSSS